jgi:hypothetical protein
MAGSRFSLYFTSQSGQAQAGHIDYAWPPSLKRQRGGAPQRRGVRKNRPSSRDGAGSSGR